MDDLKQQILEAYGVEDMSPAEREAFEAYGRAVEAERRNREAFGAWVTTRYAEAERDARELLRKAMAADA